MTPHQPKIANIVSRLLKWFSENARDLPWRRARDPYAIWVSEIMLQQTQVKTVLPYWERWMKALPDLQSLALARPARLHKLWEGLGYYTRVRNLQKAARIIRERHGGRFPETYEDILTLPGIGRYTAGAISSIAFNQPWPILDGNVIRVLSRLFGIGGDPREKKTNALLWRLAEELVQTAAQSSHAKPEGSCSRLNQSLMELGALVCAPRQPRCRACPLAALCVARKEDRVDELPAAARRPTATRRRFVAFVLESDGTLLLRQRPAGVVNARLWEFPNTEVTQASEPVEVVAERVLGFRPGPLSPLCKIEHSITRYRITLLAYEARVDRKRAGAGKPGVRRPVKTLHRLAFTAAHKKVLRAWLARRAGAAD